MYSLTVTEQAPTDEKYGKLLQSVQPKKINTEQDYQRFLILLEELLEKEEDEQLPEQEGLLLELLLVVVQDYESRKVSFPKSDPLDTLLHLMEAQGLKQAQLINVIGSSGVVSEVINGKREISKSQARSLGEFFKVSYQLFL